jgi:hypothetical protein
MNTFLARLKHDPHRRMLAVLGAAALLFLLLALVALWQRSSELAPKYEPHAFFPELRADLAKLAQVRVQSRAGTFTVRLDRVHGWTVVEKAGFPADASQVRAAAVGMADLEAIEPKTANPDWHGQLGLVAPEKGGDATSITLMDAAGKPLAALLVGHGADIADAMGRGAIYVRRPGDNQTWLVRGYLMSKPNLADWLDKNIVAVGRERIQSVDVAPPTGSAYMASRVRKDVPDFTIAPLPAGRTLAFESATDTAAGALSGFAFDDVQPVTNFDFSHPVATHVTKTFDGLVVTVRIIDKVGAHWASVMAQATAPTAQAEATAINGRASAWAFKLPDFKYNMFAATLESMLKPLAPPPGTPQQAPPPIQQ